MKWTNKGLEFDTAFHEIEKKKSWFFFGAGEYGMRLLKIMKGRIEIAGFIDNDTAKQGTMIEGYPCLTWEDIPWTQDNGIVVTPSQIPRIHIVEQLEKNGKIRNKDYFIIEDFMGIYFAYTENKVVFTSISTLPSTVCNLNCELCLNFNPYAKKNFVRDLSEVKRDIDLFFSCVDYVMIFHVSGGETFLYPYIDQVIAYLHTNYKDHIQQIRMVSNGTVIPKRETLVELSKCEFDVLLDDYRDAVPQFRDNFEKICSLFEEYRIRYSINWTDEWIDLAPTRTDHSNWSEERLAEHFKRCNQSWQDLRDGKLFLCNYSSYAATAGLSEIEEYEAFDLTEYTRERCKELVEFRLGYSQKGYASFCKRCRGFHPDNDLVYKAATQKARRS
mgnify:CR=1 FL=1